MTQTVAHLSVQSTTWRSYFTRVLHCPPFFPLASPLPVYGCPLAWILQQISNWFPCLSPSFLQSVLRSAPQLTSPWTRSAFDAWHQVVIRPQLHFFLDTPSQALPTPNRSWSPLSVLFHPPLTSQHLLLPLVSMWQFQLHAALV